MSLPRVLTRARVYETQSVSGVPGVVFALGGLGAPRLRLHGPEGLAGFLGAIRSFVRRKFPQIECVQVTRRAGDGQCSSDANGVENGGGTHADLRESDDGVVQRENWPSGEQLVDDHARIVAFVLHASVPEDSANSGANYEPTPCPFCVDGEAKPPQGSADARTEMPSSSRVASADVGARSNTLSGFKKHRGGRGDDEHARMREWLIRFYSTKEPAKVPYVDVVLNRYRGRHDELKAQLRAKYGDIDNGVANNGSAGATAVAGSRNSDASSSSSDSSDSDSDSDGNKNEGPTGKNAVLDRRWLLQFYRTHQPDKVPHVDKVLKQFQGREETLKQMLVQKYGASDEVHVEVQQLSATSASEPPSPMEPQKKKLKVDEAAGVTNDCSPANEVPIAVVADGDGDNAETNDAPTDRPVPTSVCYVIWYVLGACELPRCYVVGMNKYLTQPFDTTGLISTHHHIQSCGSSIANPSDKFQVLSPGSHSERPRARTNRRSSYISPRQTCAETPGLCISLLDQIHPTFDHVARLRRYAKWMADVSSGASQDAVPCPEHLIFDGELLQSAENGVFSLSFLASAKAAVRRGEVENREATKMAATSSSSPRVQEQQESSRSTLAHLTDFMESTKALPPHQRQRQILWRFATSQTSAHIAQSKLEFIVAKHRTGRHGFNYERTGWARYTSDEDEGTVDSSETESSVVGATPSAAASTAREQLGSPKRTDTLRKLVVLGTGSAAPSKLRASSSIYVEIGAALAEEPQTVPSLLLDCGEGTYGQLWRQFGASTPARIGGLRCIWISHHHADHQCGLVRILHEYCRYYSGGATCTAPTRLVVVAPQSVLAYVAHWLPFLSAQHGPAARLITTVTCREFNEHTHPVRCKLLGELGFAISSMYSVPVRHCYDAYGLVLTSRTGRKLVYSGDTQPCDRLVRAGEWSDWICLVLAVI